MRRLKNLFFLSRPILCYVASPFRINMLKTDKFFPTLRWSEVSCIRYAKHKFRVFLIDIEGERRRSRKRLGKGLSRGGKRLMVFMHTHSRETIYRLNPRSRDDLDSPGWKADCREFRSPMWFQRLKKQLTGRIEQIKRRRSGQMCMWRKREVAVHNGHEWKWKRKLWTRFVSRFTWICLDLLRFDDRLNSMF